MTLAQGDNAITGKFYPFQQYNRIKNHFRQSDPKSAVSNAQPGMTVSDSDDNKIWHRVEGSYTWDEVLQEQSSHDAEPIFAALLLDVVQSDAISDPPTDAELDALFGQPSTVGIGWHKFLKDIGSSGKIYLVLSDGASWYFRAISAAA